MTLWQVLLHRTIFQLHLAEIRSLFCLGDKKNTYMSVLSQDCVQILKQIGCVEYVKATVDASLSSTLRHPIE